MSFVVLKQNEQVGGWIIGWKKKRSREIKPMTKKSLLLFAEMTGMKLFQSGFMTRIFGRLVEGQPHGKPHPVTEFT